MDNKNEETFFGNSMPDVEEFIGEAHLAIENSDVHPFIIFSQILDIPLEGFSHVRLDRFPGRHESRDISQPFLMPEPAPLLAACIYLGVHPADLLPRDRDVPSPRSVLQLCKDMAEDERFSQRDREAAVELLEFESDSIEKFRDANEELWTFLEQREFIVETCQSEVVEVTFRRNSLQEIFDELNRAGMNHEAVFPIAPDATVLRTARNWDMNAKDSIAVEKVRPAYDERKRTMRVLEVMGGRLYPKDKVWEAYEATKKLLRGQKAIVPQNENDRAWIHACRDFYKADQAYTAAKSEFDESVEGIKTTYKRERFDRSVFDTGLSFFENNVIMNTSDHKSPHLDNIFEV